MKVIIDGIEYIQKPEIVKMPTKGSGKITADDDESETESGG